MNLRHSCSQDPNVWPRFRGKVATRAVREPGGKLRAFTCSVQQSLTLSHNLDTFSIYYYARCEQRAVICMQDSTFLGPRIVRTCTPEYSSHGIEIESPDYRARLR